MFYCGECARAANWPTSGWQSFGRCEMCEKPAKECNDVPSKYLPIPTEAQHEALRALRDAK